MPNNGNAEERFDKINRAISKNFAPEIYEAAEKNLERDEQKSQKEDPTGEIAEHNAEGAYEKHLLETCAESPKCKEKLLDEYRHYSTNRKD